MDARKYFSVKKYIILFAFFIFLPNEVFGGNVVVAKGISFFEQGREIIAREKALDDARRAAVEMALGTKIDSVTAVENFHVVSDRIFSHASGYIKEMEVLEEYMTDLGTYEIKIRAEVEVTDIVKDIDMFSQMLAWQKNPRVAVTLSPSTPPELQIPAAQAASLIIERFKKHGFSVYQNLDSVEVGLLIELTLERLTQKSRYQDIELTMNEVSLEARIQRPGSGEILAIAVANKSLAGEDSLNKLKQATAICVNKIWKELVSKLTATWEKELYSYRNIVIIINNIESYESAVALVPIFNNDIKGVTGAEMTGFTENSAQYNIQYRGWPEQFLYEIRLSYFKKKYMVFNVEQITGDKIILFAEKIRIGH
jgi:hypothetical protein